MNNAPPLFIFDIDGTIADLTHRLHHIKEEPKDWNLFHFECQYDKPIPHSIQTLQYINHFADVWFFTGRMDYVRAETELWIIKHTGIKTPNVTMRKTGDYRADYLVKEEMYMNMLIDDRERLVAIYDDRQQVVDMWRRIGVPCYQVAPGDF